MEDAPPATPTEVEPSQPITGPIEGDWVCIACEYPLRGLDPKGKCPECGTPIARSLRDDRLAHASPFWVFRLSQATTLSCFATLLVLIYDVPMYLPFGPAAGSGLAKFLPRLVPAVNAFVWLSHWILGTPEYVAPGHYRNRRWCWSLRVLATIAFMWQWFTYAFASSTYTPMFIWALLVIATLVVECLYLRRLAARIPDRDLYVQTPYMLAALALMYVMTNIVPRIYFVFGVHVPPVPPALMALIVLLARGYAIVILAKFSTRFTRAANSALENCVLE